MIQLRKKQGHIVSFFWFEIVWIGMVLLCIFLYVKHRGGDTVKATNKMQSFYTKKKLLCMCCLLLFPFIPMLIMVAYISRTEPYSYGVNYEKSFIDLIAPGVIQW